MSNNSSTENRTHLRLGQSPYLFIVYYRSPVCFATSQMNLHSQENKLFANMCSSEADRSSTTVLSSPFPPTVSNCAFLFIHVFCQVVKTFTAHFELYFVFLGTVSDSKAISSASVFGERKRLH